jgi:hypothetical protein
VEGAGASVDRRQPARGCEDPRWTSSPPRHADKIALRVHLRRTALGRKVYIAGGNPREAELVGISRRKTEAMYSETAANGR